MLTNFKNLQVDRLMVRTPDLHGRQSKNAADGTDQTDLITLRQLEKAIAGVQSGSGSVKATKKTTLGTAIYLLEISLVTATITTITSPTPTPNPGDILIVEATQDATGHGLIDWATGPDFKGVSTQDNDGTPLVSNAYTFVCRADGNWWLTAIMLGKL